MKFSKSVSLSSAPTRFALYGLMMGGSIALLLSLGGCRAMEGLGKDISGASRGMRQSDD